MKQVLQGRFFALFFLIFALYWVLSQSSWIQQLELFASNGASFDQFGFSVSIYGNYAIIGAPLKTIGNNSNQGVAYIFYFNGNSWIQQQELIASNGASFDQFGWSVSIYGNYAIIGAPFKTIGSNTEQGTAYVFQQTTSQQTTHQQSVSFSSKLVFKRWLLIFLFLISF